MLGLTVLVVDPDAPRRAATVGALRSLGLHALGVGRPLDAASLLQGLTADAVLMRSLRSDDPATETLRDHTVLVEVPPEARLEDALAVLMRAIHRQPDAQSMN